MLLKSLRQGFPQIELFRIFEAANLQEELQEIILISGKDVNNIKKIFNTDRIQRHSNDFVSVSTMVDEMQASDYNAVLLFKQQSVNSSKKYTSLDTHGFLFVLQTEFQKEMLVKFGKNGICVDATYNANSYSLYLISVPSIRKEFL